MRAFPLLALALLAGCLGDPAPAAAPVPDGPATPPAPVEFDCMGWAFVAFVPSTWVQPQMPPGYQALSGGGSVQGIPLPVEDGATPIGVQAATCGSIGFPDGSEVRDLTLAWSKVNLEQAGGHEVENGSDDYALELFFDVEAAPRLAQHFQAFGWPVRDALVELTPDTMRVQADGAEYSASRGAPLFPWVGEETAEDDDPVRNHHVAASPSYGSVGDVEIRSYGLWSSTLLARGGFFGSLGPSGTLEGSAAAPLAGVGQIIGFRGPSVLQWADDVPA